MYRFKTVPVRAPKVAGRRPDRMISPIREIHGGRTMDFFSLIKGAEAEGKEKHVPVIELGSGHEGTHEDIVRVTVGKDVAHPNTAEHYIAWIELYGIKDEKQIVYLGRQDFTPVLADPTAKFKIRMNEFTHLVALSYCNIHGLWKNELKL